MKSHTLKSQIRNALKSEDGSMSVEFALWVPVIFMTLMLIADTSAAFFAQANMWDSAGDISRALATGRISMAEAQQFISTHTRFQMEVGTIDNVIMVQLSRPFSDIGTGIALSFVGNLEVQAFQHVEEGVEL